MEFKATGKQILEPGWRVVYNKPEDKDEEEEQTQLLPEFILGEKGPHTAYLAEGKTTPPKLYTEATLLRAMETAGKQVDDEELRDLMKDNGIGRPSTRAAIIETLFRRKYMVRERKNIVATITGIELIKTINNELLKSAELTGNWENKIRKIEKGEYEADTFISEMKQMISELVHQVKNEWAKRITISDETLGKTKNLSLDCPKCKKGNMLKGKTAFGCSGFKSGCDFKIPFELMGKKLTDSQITSIIENKKTNVIKGFNLGGTKKDGILKLTPTFNIELEEQQAKTKKKKKEDGVCPKCKTGNILKGKTAYGCSNWKTGCDFRLAFENVTEK